LTPGKDCCASSWEAEKRVASAVKPIWWVRRGPCPMVSYPSHSIPRCESRDWMAAGAVYNTLYRCRR